MRLHRAAPRPGQPVAGAGPPASAVVADIIDLARGRVTPTFGIAAESLRAMPVVPMDDRIGLYYVRVMVHDKPGVFADIAGALRDSEISIESAIQRGRDEIGRAHV